ncbi:Cobalt import ATP-binding protein CbiO [Blastochloris viridis]|uniref:Cobalt import ATP-binding protein CbiO n=1 Tax=Blastochloris viridis TaxID=1079 RepID=A0A0S4Q1X9_BLAVI|nr:Cobalt import ATP-binding protein CbiO [Blastochloris viridis]
MLLEARNLSFAYPGQPEVLSGADLALATGERLCLEGANGAGKSTLLQILVGLLLPQVGTVVAFGRERRAERDFHEVRCRAGLVFQDPDDQLFCPTVAEDVAFGPLNTGHSRGEAAAIVARVLDELRLSHLRDRVTHKLSGGEKRLVTLAAVLAMEPQVLLLDEPTNALDEPTRERLIGILHGLPQAMIIVSHDPLFRRSVATRSVRLIEGRVQAVDDGQRDIAHGPRIARQS